MGAVAMFPAPAREDELAVFGVEICDESICAASQRTQGKAGLGVTKAEAAAILIQ